MAGISAFGDLPRRGLAAAFGAGVFCCRGTQEARAQAGVEKNRRRARVSHRYRHSFRAQRGSTECVAMRQRRSDPAAVEAEIARIPSLALDALRRRWRAALPVASITIHFPA